MKDAGTANAIKNDIHYVNEMKRCHDEIFNIINQLNQIYHPIHIQPQYQIRVGME